MNDYEKALAILRESGWTKNTFEDDWGRFCSLGALDKVRENTEHTIHDGLLAEVVREQYADRVSVFDMGKPVPAFNDHPMTTFADVVRVFEKAAVRSDEIV